MPKKIFKLPAFDKGTVGNMSPRDIPEGALSYSENVDSRVQGKVKGRRDDELYSSNFHPFAMSHVAGGENYIIGQHASNNLIVAYDTESDAANNLGQNTDYIFSTVPRGKAVYAGMSEDVYNPDSDTRQPVWVGVSANPQFPMYTGNHISGTHSETDTTLNVDTNDAGGTIEVSSGDYILLADPWGIYSEIALVSSTNNTNSTITVERAVMGSVASELDSDILIYEVIMEEDYHYGNAHADSLDGDGVVELDSFSDGTTGWGSGFLSDRTYFYAYSLVYDGFQESPLVKANTHSPAEDDINILFDVNIDFDSASEFSNRITAINIYRSESTNSRTEQDPYRLITSIDLSKARHQGTNIISPSNNDTGTNSFKYNIHDDGSNTGATYENNSGLSETLDHVDVQYKLNTAYSGYMFVGDCRVSGVPDAERYVYRSKPYSYSVIDWTRDYAILPEKPVALEGYNGRIYAFCKSAIYRINPATMSVEDEYRGAGSHNHLTTIATNYGMFHADDTNIYINDGRTSKAIGTPIQTVQYGNNSYGWADMQKSDSPNRVWANMAFDVNHRRLLVYGTVNGSTHVCWAYDVEYEQWHLYTGYNLLPSSFTYGHDGTLYASFGEGGSEFDLYTIATNSNRMNWVAVSKDFDLGSDSGDFWAYDIQGFGSGAFDIKYLKNGSNTIIDQGTSNDSGLRKTTVNPNDKKMKSIAVRVESASGSDELDNLTVQYRPQVIRE